MTRRQVMPLFTGQLSRRSAGRQSFCTKGNERRALTRPGLSGLGKAANGVSHPFSLTCKFAFIVTLLSTTSSYALRRSRQSV